MRSRVASKPSGGASLVLTLGMALLHLRFTTCIASSCGLLNTELKDNDAFVAVDRGYVDIDLVLKQIKTFSVTPLRQEMRQISQTVFCGTTTCRRCLISRFLDCLSEAV